MAVDQEQGLDGLPLLKATFDDNVQSLHEKFQEARRVGIGRWLTKLPVRPSLGILKPSFLDRNADSRPAQPTAWLDGLRGVAAFFVFLYHFQHLFHNNFYMGYGANNGKNDYWLIQLPIIRLIFTGGPMVSVFWVLSGVSLSLKPIKLMRSRSWEQFQETMFSSVFRRALRLYIPVYTVQLCVLLATLLGFFDHASDLHKDWPFKGGTNEDFFEVKNTAGEQIYDWVTSMVKLSSPFKPIRPKYDVHLWTIPLEFRNSIVLFATLVAFSKLRSRIRIVLSLALYSYCVLVEEGDVALFIAGMTCAEFLLIKDEQAKQLPAAEKPSPRTQSLRAKIIWTIVYITGLHLLSIPAWRHEHTPGYRTLVYFASYFVKGTETTIQRIGAAIVLLGLCGSEFLRKPFSTSLAIYMGKISFPLYIVHGPLTHLLGVRLVPFFWNIVGKDTLWQYDIGVGLAFVVQAVIVVWVADIVMRTVDTPSVRFGRTLQNWCAVRS